MRANFSIAFDKGKELTSKEASSTEASPLRCFFEVPVLSPVDAAAILDSACTARGRTLTQLQRTVLLDAFRACPLPLFLKLAIDRAMDWRSGLTNPVLGADVPALIDDIFNR